MSDAPQYALRFISGKYQGGEFPLKTGREIVIGRSSDLDMVLVEDMVSRRHAKISTVGDQIVIEDLGSTNGSFVNGEKVSRVRLREGDRILIGTSIMKLIQMDEQIADRPATQGGVNEPVVETRSRSGSARKATVTSARSMAGTIDEIPLPDLLQLLSTSKKSGVLEIQNDDCIGRIFMRQGQVCYATIDDRTYIKPQKAIYRMLVWDRGAFELNPPDERDFDDELNIPTEGLLMEAMRQLDEIRRLEDELPPPGSELALASPMGKPLRELQPEQLDMVQVVNDQRRLRDVLDHSPTPDLETYEALLKLMRDKVICVV